MSWFGKAPAAAEAPAAPMDAAIPAKGGSSALPSSSARGEATIVPAQSSLFDRYAAPVGSALSRITRHGHFQTRTSRLRAGGVKLACYLNTEVDRGRATIISLPEECDTLGEVLPKIQLHMKLDKRMLYAAELFVPNGDRLNTYADLVDAAEKDTAIVVGCGEPFDQSTIPYDILEFHLHGGGRQAASKVKKELADKRQLDAYEKADSVRQSGHGVHPNSVAVVTARSQTMESNRNQAAQMRHEYMEQLMFRASQQKEMVDRVQMNNAMHKMEMLEAKSRRGKVRRAAGAGEGLVQVGTGDAAWW